MVQQGQTFELTRRGPDGERLWAYRDRIGGRDSKRVQRGGFTSEADVRAALERALEKQRRGRGVGRRLTLAEFADEYLAVQRGQQRAICPSQLRPCGRLPAQDRELMAQDEQLQLLRATPPAEQPNEREQAPHDEIHKRPEQAALPRP